MILGLHPGRVSKERLGARYNPLVAKFISPKRNANSQFCGDDIIPKSVQVCTPSVATLELHPPT